jgi:hypothetical protein
MHTKHNDQNFSSVDDSQLSQITGGFTDHENGGALGEGAAAIGGGLAAVGRLLRNSRGSTGTPARVRR